MKSQITTIGIFLCWMTGAQLHAQTDNWPEVFNPFKVSTIHFQVDTNDWENIRHDTNFYDPTLNVRVPCLMWSDDETNQLTVQIRRKSDPAQPSEADPQKVSLKIDINEYVAGQEWRGLKKLSLENGGGNGVLREAFAMNLHRLASEAGFYPYDSGYASWIRVVVNGNYVGLYANPEDRDKQFLRNRGMYKPGAVWLYESNPGAILDTTVATSHSPTYSNVCYSPFDSRCSQPNTPTLAIALEREISARINVSGMLTQAAIEAFTANGDGLFTHTGKNSFFVDFLFTNQFGRFYFPWDLDTGISEGFGDVTFNIYTGGKGPANQRKYQIEILGHNWFRQVYRHIMTDLLDGPLSTEAQTAFLNQLEPVLAAYIAEDPNADDSFATLRAWITNRVANVRTQLGTITGAPRFNQNGGEIIPGFPLSLTHTNAAGTIYYTLDGTDPRSLGGGTNATAYSTPIILNDTAHVMARVANGTNWSALRQATFNIAGHANSVRVTEIMFNPTPGTNFDASEYEFIELKNVGGTPVDLSNCYFDGFTYKFAPKTMVVPSARIVLVRNPVAFAARYPGVAFHGIYFGGLAATGEKIRLKNSDGNNIFSVSYSNKSPWPFGANGMGYSLVNINPNGDPDDAENWRASTSIHGSPGADDPAPPYGLGVVINEVLAHTDTPFEDAIELYNTSFNDVNISGWYLSDSLNETDPARASLKKYKIPAGTIVSARGYKVFYENAFNPGTANANALVPFAFSKFGEDVYLSSADGSGNLTGHIVGFAFGAQDNPATYGRHQTSVGPDLTFLETHTFGVSNPASKSEFRTGTGLTNSAPKIGPVIINEIMYQPGASANEFVELYNLSSTNIDLGGWVMNGASYTFATNTIISSNGFLLLVGTTNLTEAQFRSANNVPAAVPILMHKFDLQNDGEKLELQKVNDDPLGPPILVDRVRYNDKAPWPTEADGSGPSLERIAPTLYGNDPANWRTTTAGGTPGKPNGTNSVIAIANGSSWQAQDAGWNLGNVWRHANYSSSGWFSGDGVLGYGDPSVATILTNAAALRPITTYFRKQFVVNDAPSDISQLNFSAKYNDGFVAYLNGEEILRRSMPSGDVTSATFAFAHSAESYEAIDLSSEINKLVRGKNILAVEVHQAGANDPDLVWDAQLTYSLSANATSNLRIVFAEADGAGNFTLRWSSVAGENYRVQKCSDLVSWTNASPTISATNTTTEFIETIEVGSGSQFFRILLDP